MAKRKPILVVSHNEDDHTVLREMLSPEWKIIQARSTSEALAILTETEIPVAIVEADLPDGDWHLLCEFSNVLPQRLRPTIIVTSRLADNRLWSEVLNEGGYDVLSQPFDRDEVVRVAELADYHKTNNKAHGIGN